MKKAKHVVIMAMLTIFMLFLLSGCNEPTFESAVKNGDYIEAVELYNQEYYGNAAKEKECESFLTLYWEESWEDYCSGKMDADKFDSIYVALEKVCEKIGYLDFATLQLQYERVKGSKKAYAEACQAIEDKEYQEAMQLFDSVSAEDTENYEAAMQKLHEAENLFCEGILLQTREQADRKEYDQALEFICEFYQACTIHEMYDMDKDFLTRTYDMIVQVSTEKYENLMDSAFAKEDYLAALEHYYGAVNDIYAETTESMMEIQTVCEDAILEQIRALGEEAGYETACSHVNRFGMYRLISSYKLEELLTEIGYTQYENSFTAAMEDEDYLTAIYYARELVDFVTDDDFFYWVSRLDEVEDLYENKAKEEAQAAFGTNKDYEAAIAVLQRYAADAKDVLQDEWGMVTRLTDEIDYYNEYIPIKLITLTPTQKNGMAQVAVEDAYKKDVSSNWYDAKTVMCDWRSSVGDSYIQYNLNMEYSVFTGTIYRPYIMLSCTHPWKNAPILEIYGDGRLLYKAPSITEDTFDPVEFKVDVSGVRNLKIVMEGYCASCHDAMICLAETMLQK